MKLIMPRARLVGCLIILVALVLGSVGSGDNVARVALVIGNANYQHVTPLANPGNDADAVAEKLLGLGFAVHKAVDYSLPATREAIRRFRSDSAGAEIALIFYAGHGLQLGGENYLLPVDARISSSADLPASTLRVSELRGALEEGGAELGVLILDACRDNPFAEITSALPGLASGVVPDSRTDLQNEAGMLIAFAAAPGAVAADGTDGNSPFTTALIQWLDRPGLEIGTMFRNVRRTVVQLTERAQVPWVEESLLRDVYLNPGYAPGVQVAGAAHLDDSLIATINAFANDSERRAGMTYLERLFPNSIRTAAVDPQLREVMSDAEEDFLRQSLTWLSIRESSDPAIFESFISTFPGSSFVPLAEARLQTLSAPPTEPEAEIVVELVLPEVRPEASPPPPDRPPLEIAAGPDDTLGGQGPPVAAEDAQDEGVFLAEASGDPQVVEAALVPGPQHRVALQRLLGELDLYQGALDGAFGPLSRRALEDVQAELAVAPTGFLDPVTLQHLVERAAPKALEAEMRPEDRRALQELAAAGLRGPGAEPVFVRIDMLFRHPRLTEYWQELARAFETSHPGVVVEFRTEPHPVYRHSLLQKLGSTEPPDIFYTYGGGYLGAVVEAGFARDLTEEMGAGWALQFKPGAIENLTMGDRIFAVPFNITLISLYANRALLEQANVDPAELRSWSGIIEATDRLKAAGITPLAVAAGERWPLLFWWESLAIGLGGKTVLDRALAGEGEGFEDPVFVQAGRMMGDLVRRDPFQPGFHEAFSRDAWGAFAEGRAAMILEGNWALPTFMHRWEGGAQEAASDLVRIDFPPQDLPYSEALTYGGVPAWVVREGAPDQAVEFLRILTGLEAQRTGAEMGFDIPTVAGVDSFLATPLLSEIATRVTTTGHHQLGFNLLLGPEAGEVLSNSVYELVTGQATAEAVAVNVQDAWEAASEGPSTDRQADDAPLLVPAE